MNIINCCRCVFTILVFFFDFIQSQTLHKPNVVIIMADDMGFSDVSMHGSEIPTPNIDALGMNGVILNRFYTPIMCTPSRSSLLTGKYPIHTGMQHYVIDQDQPWGLGLQEKIMPEFFKEAGYQTHLIGKWHQGFFRRAYTPNSRGFDTFFGYLGPYIDYWDHTFIKSDRNYSRGIDFRRDYNIVREYNGTYATNLFTDEAIKLINDHDKTHPMFLLLNHLAPHAGNEDDPMQAPQEIINKFNYIKDEKRRTMAAMISILDEGVGAVINALDVKKILNETIILFYSDNGAPTEGLHSNKGSNFPFKGQKNTPWEGGMRIPAAIWSTQIAKQHVSNEWMHISDILPTLAAATNISLGYFAERIDGVNHWPSLINKSAGPRNQILHNIDDIFGYSTIVDNGWKLIQGTTNNGEFDRYLGGFIESDAKMNSTYYFSLINGSTVNMALRKFVQTPLDFTTVEDLHKKSIVTCVHPTFVNECSPIKSACLFNLNVDPCEINNLALMYPEKVDELKSKIKKFALTAETPRNKPRDPKSDPRFHDGVWTYWWDEQKLESQISSNKILWILIASVSFIATILLIIGVMIINKPTKKHSKKENPERHITSHK